MNIRVSGSLLASGMLFIIFLNFILIGQLEFYNNHLSFYRLSINMKEAQTMRNIAQTYHLHEHECLRFNTGRVCLEKQKYEITLNNGYHCSLDSFK